MRKLKILTMGSGGIWLLTAVMIFLFPRQKYLAISTVFAVLFWISLIITCFFTFLLIKSIRNRKKRQRKNKNKSSATLQKKPKNTGSIAPETNSPEVKK